MMSQTLNDQKGERTLWGGDMKGRNKSKVGTLCFKSESKNLVNVIDVSFIRG